MSKKFRFFYHYNKFTGRMTIHFRKQCIPVNEIICQVPCETKFNKSQPRLVMRGWASIIEIDETRKAIIT